MHDAVAVAKLLQKLFPAAICGYFQNGKYGILQVGTAAQDADAMWERLSVFLSNQLGFPKCCETNAWFYADCVRTCAGFSLSAAEKQLAEQIQAHFSVGYFRNLYRSFFGISYVQDCIAAKMNRAKYLLLSTSLHIEEIAVQCGYLDAKYFMRLFQKSIGCTPSQYRKKFI